MQSFLNNSYRYFLVFVLASALLTLAGCGSLQQIIAKSEVQTEGPAISETKLPRKVTIHDVEEAYKNGHMQLAERMAEKFTSSSEASPQELGRAWRVQALSAVENQHPQAAEQALEHWRLSMEGADASPEWRKAWYDMLTQMPANEANKIVQSVIASANSRPASLVREAKLFSLEGLLKQGNGGAAIPGLVSLYESYSSNADKRYIEQRTWLALHATEGADLARLMSYTSDNNENKYPFALIRLENARRTFWDLSKQESARENVRFISTGSLLADTSIFNTWNEPDYSPLEKVYVRNREIALVLPLTGQYGNLSEKIVRGAETVRRGLELQGKTLRIYVIDSDQPDWMLELSRLPKSVQIIGGPLRMEDYNAVKNMGLTDKHFFFSFLPRMDEADEGRISWRFFPSREDQVRVMLDYAQKLGVKNYSIFAPDQGDYAKSMFSLFYYQAAERNLTVSRSGYYPARQYQLWVKSVSDFLGYTQTANKDRSNAPDLEFNAMFLPDNWSNAARIISHIFYVMDNNLLFLGTNLWENGLADQQRLNTRNFRLTIFPGVWNQQTLSPSGQAVRSSAALTGKYNADLWFSLGYDFAMAATSLGLPENAKADDVNAALAQLPRLPWSGAPISWDAQGFAQQELFVLTPAENGFVLANENRIRQRMAAVIKAVPAAQE